MRRYMRDIFSVKCDLTAARFHDANDRIHKRCFSGAVTADEADDLALIYFQADSLQGMDRAVISMQILNL